MKVLFLSLAEIRDLSERGIYSDLLRQFVKNGHFVRVVSPTTGITEDLQMTGYAVLKVHTQQMQKVNFIKKGIASLLIGPNIKRALKQYCADEHYDLILTATPPITIAGVVKSLKSRDNSRVYLLLKDIWPQGIVDLGVISKRGLIYRYFRSKEKWLYGLADHIGCMSPANVDYLIQNNPEIDPIKVEICPNSVEPLKIYITPEEKTALLKKYGIPNNRTIFIYGGNLGPVQCIPFLVKCLKQNQEKQDRFFVICGTGTQAQSLKNYIQEEKPSNILLMDYLPKEEFDRLVSACDVGLIFTDYRFTIPNFPSRLLSYLQAEIPVLCCTDPNTDIGDIAEAGRFGWKCLSDDPEKFTEKVDYICKMDLSEKGTAAFTYLLKNYTAEAGYKTITREKE